MQPLSQKTEDFCNLVRQVVASLPRQFRKHLENVVVDVEPRPSPRTLRLLGMEADQSLNLMGLFEGKPIPQQAYREHHPNRIVLFQDSIEAKCDSPEEVRYEVRRTILHEVAHHFGFSEEDLEPFESVPSPYE